MDMQLQPDTPLYARRPFPYGGIQFNKGDPFPMPEDLRKAQRMINSGHVTTTPSLPARRVQPQPEPARLVKRGAGWFDVLVDGKKINPGALRIKDAEALAQGSLDETKREVQGPCESQPGPERDLAVG